MFCKKGAPGKKVPQACNDIKEETNMFVHIYDRYVCILVNFTKFLRTTFLWNTSVAASENKHVNKRFNIVFFYNIFLLV